MFLVESDLFIKSLAQTIFWEHLLDNDSPDQYKEKFLYAKGTYNMESERLNLQNTVSMWPNSKMLGW